MTKRYVRVSMQHRRVMPLNYMVPTNRGPDLSFNAMVQQHVANRAAQIASVRNQLLAYQTRYVNSLNAEYPTASTARKAVITGRLNQIAISPLPSAPDPNIIGYTLNNVFNQGNALIWPSAMFPADPSGQSDASGAINNCLLAASQQGVPCVGSPGNYYCANPILFNQGQTVWMQPGCTLLFPFFSTGDNANLMNTNILTQINNIRWYGGTLSKTPPTQYGRLCSLYMNGVMEDVVCSGFYGYGTIGQGGGAFVPINTSGSLSMNYCRAINSTGNVGNTGIRLTGAAAFNCSYCDITVGDAALQFAPADSGPLGNFNINNAAYNFCIGNSYASYPLLNALITRSAPMTDSITNWQYNWCAGYATSRAFVIQNTAAAAPNLIGNGTMSNLYFDCANCPPPTNPCAWFDSSFTSPTGVQNITTSMVCMLNALDQTILNHGTTNVNTSGIDYTNVNFPA